MEKLKNAERTPVQVWLSPKQHQKLKIISTMEQVPMSKIVKIALMKYLEAEGLKIADELSKINENEGDEDV